MITALTVANNIIARASEEKIQVSPMKLQKLLYFIYKEYLKISGASLFAERFEVWKYGPVLPSVYDEFKEFGVKPINRRYTRGDGSAWMVDEGSSRWFVQAIVFVWNRYKHMSGVDLSNLTHMKDTAWSKAREKKTIFLSDTDIKAEVWA